MRRALALALFLMLGFFYFGAQIGFYDQHVRYELVHDRTTLIVGVHMFRTMVRDHYCKRVTIRRDGRTVTHICLY